MKLDFPKNIVSVIIIKFKKKYNLYTYSKCIKSKIALNFAE